MKKQIVIEYDIIDETVQIKTNEFTIVETFGILEAVKQMTANHWFSHSETEAEE